MRPLNDYFLPVSTFASVEISGLRSAPAVVADGGKLQAVAFGNVGPQAPDVDATFDIIVNNSDTGSDVTIPSGTAVDAGVTTHPTPSVYVQPGDVIELESNGESSNAFSVIVTHVVRR